MHLPKLPTIFVKDGVERKAYFTVEARELVAAGWVEKGKEVKKEAPIAEAAPEIEEAPKPAPAPTVRKTTAKKEVEE